MYQTTSHHDIIQLVPGMSASVNAAPQRKQRLYVTITDDIRAILRRYHDIGLLPSRVLTQTPDKPNDLRTIVIQGWLTKSQTACADHLALVLSRCAELEHDVSPRIPITSDMIDAIRYQEPTDRRQRLQPTHPSQDPTLRPARIFTARLVEQVR